MGEKRVKIDNPVLSGLVALLAVALTVGLVLAGVALVATRLLGIGGDDSTAADASAKESVHIPRPSKTQSSGPAVTLNTDGGESESESEEESDEDEDDEEKKDKKAKEDEQEITLQANQTAVGSFERIDLTGVYPGGEGAILQVERFEDGKWAEFDATIPVSNETFTTYVQSAQTGVNRFRVVDSDTGEASNDVRVKVG